MDTGSESGSGSESDTVSTRVYRDLPQSRQWRKLRNFYKKGFLCDVEFTVGDESLSAHKIVLSAASQYFQVMFQSGFTEKLESRVDFSTTFGDIETLRNVVDYVYEGEIYLTGETILEILDVSVQFLLPDLQGHCVQFLLERLQPSNVLETWRAACLYDIHELEEISQIVAEATFCRKYIFSESVYYMNKSFLHSFIHDIRLKLNSVDRFELVMLWLSYDYENRLEDAEHLINNYLEQNPLPSGYKIDQTDAFDNIEPEVKTSIINYFSPVLLKQTHYLEIESLRINDENNRKYQWCLMVQEEGNDVAAFYCALTKAWYLTKILWEPGEFKGIIDPHYLVKVAAKTDVTLINLTDNSRKHVSNIFRSLNKKDLLLDDDSFDLFCADGNLYIIITALSGVHRRPNFVIYQYDIRSDTWAHYMDIIYEHLGAVMLPGDKATVHLRTHIDLLDSYLMVYVITKRRVSLYGDCKKNSNNSSGEFRYEEMFNFHVMSFDVSKKTFEVCGARWNEPVNLYKSPAVVMKDRICFLKHLDNRLSREKFRSTFYHQEECYMDAVCLLLEDGTWEKVTIGLPCPHLHSLPITSPTPFFESQITAAFDKLYIGIQQAPYVYQISMYNLETFTAVTLPYTSLPIVGNPKITAFCCRTSISTWIKQESIEDEEYHFEDYTMKIWNGTKLVP